MTFICDDFCLLAFKLIILLTKLYALERICASLTPGSAHCAGGGGKPRGSRGGTQGGLNGLTHVLRRCLPTPTEEADGNGYGVIAGRGGPSRPPPRASVT